MPAPAPPVARAALVLLGLVLLPDRALAQQRFQFGGSLGLVEVYDDNLFLASEARERDHIWRLSPRLSLGRRSPRLTLLGRYGLDAETYRRHSSLDTPLAAQDASLELSWTASRRLVASARAFYGEAQSPGALNTLTGLELGRLRGHRLSATELLSWRMGASTEGTLEQSFTREEVAGFPRTDTQGVSLGLERRLGPIDRSRVRYSARRFSSDGEVILSHVVTLGWSHEITPLAHFELDAGPRLSGRTVDAEVSVGLRHRFRQGEAGVAYVQTQTTVLGEAGPVTTKGVTLTFSRQFLGSLTVLASPAFFRIQGRGSEAAVHRLNLEVAWRVTRRLSLAASHQFGRQEGGLGLGRPDAEIVHNRLQLRAVASAGN